MDIMVRVGRDCSDRCGTVALANVGPDGESHGWGGQMRGSVGSLRQRVLVRASGAIAVLAGAVTVGLAMPSGATDAPTPVSQASTSSRGVSASAINVVFPLISFGSIEGEFEIESDAEYGEQVKAIHLFVNQINAAGGINGRKINPMIESFDPTDAAVQRSLCKQWTEGNPPVFAVIDGLGTWEGDNQLCVTQEGHTPMLAQWTTTTNWTEAGSPYLWWTGADDRARPRCHRELGAELGSTEPPQEGRCRCL